MNTFPNRIEKYSDESLEGFLYRLALVNYRDFKELDIKYVRDYAKEKDIKYNVDRIYNLTGLSISEERIFPYNWYLQGLTLPEWKQKLYTRYCPACLRVDLYHRAIWCLSHHTYCFEHKVYLLEKCACCHKKLVNKDITLGKYDLNYLQLKTLKKIFKLPQEVVHKSLCKHNIKLIIHPRNQQKLIHKDMINMILYEFKHSKHSVTYLSLDEMYQLMKRNQTSLEIIYEFLKIPNRKYEGEICFHFKTISEQLESFNRYATH